MIRKLKMLILKIVFSPIWLVVAFAYFIINTWEKLTIDEEIDIWEYWRL
jgi:hypothetical protein